MWRFFMRLGLPLSYALCESSHNTSACNNTSRMIQNTPLLLDKICCIAKNALPAQHGYTWCYLADISMNSPVFQMFFTAPSFMILKINDWTVKGRKEHRKKQFLWQLTIKYWPTRIHKRWLIQVKNEYQQCHFLVTMQLNISTISRVF